jgi:hypothetical protein
MTFTWSLSTVLYRALVSLALFSTSPLNAYRVGDAVDTIVWTKAGAKDAMRSQMPLFGISNKINVPRFDGPFSFGFEEGLHSLPWMEAYEARYVEKMVVTFIFSTSGVGAIHSVSSEPVMRSRVDKSDHPKEFQIEYKWVEEEPVDIQAGVGAMFLATLVLSIIFLLQACGLSDDGDKTSDTDYMDPNSQNWGRHGE